MVHQNLKLRLVKINETQIIAEIIIGGQPTYIKYKHQNMYCAFHRCCHHSFTAQAESTRMHCNSLLVVSLSYLMLPFMISYVGP